MNELENRFEELFADELKLIENPDLRAKVVKCWVETLQRSPFEFDDLQRIPFTLLIEDAPFNLIEHTKAVTHTAIKIAEGMKEVYGERVKIDMDTLVAGALLHDVGKLLEYEPRDGNIVKSEFGKRLRHPVSGAAVAYMVGLPIEVVHAITAHSKEGNFTKRTIESIIIHHADFVNFEPFKE